MGFIDRYEEAKRKKKSVLCVGIDPVSQFMEPGEASIGKRYFESASEVDGMFEFCMDSIKNVADSCCAIKPNMQFVMAFGLERFKRMNALAHERGLISILDNKLGDIGSTNKSSFYWARQAGFDALTFSPFAGNIAEATIEAHKHELGLIVLTLMTNPDAKYFMREATVGGKSGYAWIAQQIGKNGADGAVVGSTHTKREEILEIRKEIGKDKVILIPGIGAQGGDLSGTIEAFGGNILVNVGRGVLYAGNQRAEAKKYNEILNGLMKGVG
jgi:orotidine-5'-phosphate decarboxylase